MTTIYKRQNLANTVRNVMAKTISQTAMQRNLAVKRCTECGLLYQTWKMYKQTLCQLCRYEKFPQYKAKIIELNKKKGERFDEEKFYDHHIKIHKELAIRKKNLNQALKVTTINEPICKRLL